MTTRTYTCWDDASSGQHTKIKSKSSEEACTEYAEPFEAPGLGEWGYQVHVHWRTRDNEGSHNVPVEPRVPECDSSRGDHFTDRDEDGHDWRAPRWLGGLESNPGVLGHGGGVIATTVCRSCGMYLHVDTWHTDMATGANYVARKYEASDEESQEWIASIWDAQDAPSDEQDD